MNTRNCGDIDKLIDFFADAGRPDILPDQECAFLLILAWRLTWKGLPIYFSQSNVYRLLHPEDRELPANAHTAPADADMARMRLTDLCKRSQNTREPTGIRRFFKPKKPATADTDLDDFMIEEENLGQELDNAEIEDGMRKEIIEDEEGLETTEEEDLEMMEEEEYLEMMEDVGGVLFTFLIFVLICCQGG